MPITPAMSTSQALDSKLLLIWLITVHGTTPKYSSIDVQHCTALMDWNNNYGDDPDKAVCFHCSNLPKDFFENVRMDYQDIIAGTVGKDNTYGTCVGRVKASPMSYCRLSTRDREGKIAAYVGEGRFTDDPIETFGGYAVAEIPRMQDLLHYICENGFEHHVATNMSSVAGAVYEAAQRYLGWNIYYHR